MHKVTSWIVVTQVENLRYNRWGMG